MSTNRQTSTTVITLARTLAQDKDASSNYAVSDTDALILLNDILAAWSQHFGLAPYDLGASDTGLTFSAGDVTALTDGEPTWEDVMSFHQSNSGTLSYPLSPALERVTVEQIQDMLGYDGDNALSQQASEWTHVAMERAQQDDHITNDTQKWRVWAYPVINRTRYMTVRALPIAQVASGKYMPVSEGDTRVIARLLAWEIARLKKETTQAFLDNILSPVPKDVLSRIYGGGVLAAQKPDRVIWRDWD